MMTVVYMMQSAKYMCCSSKQQCQCNQSCLLLAVVLAAIIFYERKLWRDKEISDVHCCNRPVSTRCNNGD
eukprot:12104-Heterococcus_DN1.PRE.10